MADPREEAIRRQYYQPRSLVAERAASSKPGQVYHTMTSLQDRMSRPGYTNTKADIDQLKGLRREWNWNQKYTPQGMRSSGATTPMDAQDVFRRQSGIFRLGNKPAYNTMYPFTGLAMDYMDKGGIGGMILSGVAKKTLNKVKDFTKEKLEGITEAFAGDSEKEKAEYVAKTFGPYPTDIHPGLPMDEEPLLVDEEPVLSREDEIRKVIEDHGIDTSAEFLLTPSETEEDLRRKQLLKEAEENMVWSDAAEAPDASSALYELDEGAIQEASPPIVPFDEGREDYIAASGMDPDLLRREKLESIYPEDQRMFERMTPHLDREIPTNISVDFEEYTPPPPINYRDDPRTESGIANLMPGGPLYDAIPMGQRLNMRIAEQMRERGPHFGEPRTSYYGSNWYEEYKRKLENEMEVNKGIRSPIDR